MTQYYTPPTGNDTRGFYELFSYVNTTASGMFFPMIMLVVWIVSFMAMKQYSTSRAFAFASFFCTILSIILAVLNLVTPKIMYLGIFMTAIGLVWLKLETTP